VTFHKIRTNFCKKIGPCWLDNPQKDYVPEMRVRHG